ncbi:interleukin-31 [Oryctolagus cuniculus]|uniref:interleukin-31 n=1 Tax=Oryctolagus cuniculus TaxID=9986 RepID=UPI00387A599B
MKKIFRELETLSKKLLEEYKIKESNVPQAKAQPSLPCFAPGAHSSSSIGAIQMHLKAIKDQSNRTLIEIITEHLDKLKDKPAQDEPEAGTSCKSAPTVLECKSFALAVLQQFSRCMAQVHDGLRSLGARCEAITISYEVHTVDEEF